MKTNRVMRRLIRTASIGEGQFKDFLEYLKNDIAMYDLAYVHTFLYYYQPDYEALSNLFDLFVDEEDYSYAKFVNFMETHKAEIISNIKEGLNKSEFTDFEKTMLEVNGKSTFDVSPEEFFDYFNNGKDDMSYYVHEVMYHYLEAENWGDVGLEALSYGDKDTFVKYWNGDI